MPPRLRSPDRPRAGDVRAGRPRGRAVPQGNPDRAGARRLAEVYRRRELSVAFLVGSRDPSVGAVSSGEFPGGGGAARPGRWVPPPGARTESRRDDTLTDVTREGTSWRLGTATDVAWIGAGTSVDRTVNSAVPAVFEAYATITLPDDWGDRAPVDAALMWVLRVHAGDQPWWLGYLGRVS